MNTENTALKILLVDDSPESRVLFGAYLKKIDCVIIPAENGAEALQKLKAERFDLVLMDIEMPEMDGMECASLYREWEKQNLKTRTVLIAITGYFQPKEIEKIMEAGFDEHLSKPVKKEFLLEVVKTWSSSP